MKLYNTETGELLPYPREDGDAVVGLDPYLVPVEVIRNPPPEYDHSTQIAERIEQVDLVAETYTYGYIVRDLTEQELLDRLPPYYETSTGLLLATTEHDQTAFTRMLTLIDLNQQPEDSMVIIKDAAGEKHGLTVTQFKAIMREYGAHCYQLHAQ